MENRSPYENDHPTSPTKRSSIENLKRASRVKNSSMFAREHKQEYDPTSSPLVERPLAGGRPLSTQVQSNAFGGKGIEASRNHNTQDEHKNVTQSPLRAAMQNSGILGGPTSPNKGHTSPMKSSLSSKSRYVNAQTLDQESSIWDDEEDSIADRQLPAGKSLHRHAKSVTFNAAPPEVNEYEMTTPDPSSVASGSREGSHESTEDEDESFDRGSSIDRDDSFDASLEDTEKTPVVLPEDWRFMSPGVANEDLAAKVDDPFNGEAGHASPTLRPLVATDAFRTSTRSDSTASDGERRPLPPLPAFEASISRDKQSKPQGGLAATVERSISPERAPLSPPHPASISKAELQGMGGSTMPIDERLRLMMLQDDNDNPKTVTEAAEEQRERRLRRGSPVRTAETLAENKNGRTQEAEQETDDVADLGDYQLPPRISRESILRKVKSRNLHNEFDDDNSSMLLSPASGSATLATLDPDVPLPSTEVEIVETEIDIKQESDGEQSEVDVYSIPDLYSSTIEAESYLNAIEKLEAIKQSRSEVEPVEDDDESHYSVDSKTNASLDQVKVNSENESLATPRASSPHQAEKTHERKQNHRMSLPQFAALLGEHDFGLGMESFMSDSPPTDQEPTKQASLLEKSWSPSLQREQEPCADQIKEGPSTPEAQMQRPSSASHDEEPGTPDSVIRHSFSQEPAPDSPSIPEPVATIKASGSKLKTRPSATPSDIRAMAEVRRQVSGEVVPSVPAIPQKHLGRPSVVAEGNESIMDTDSILAPNENSEETVSGKQAKRKSSLLPLDVAVEQPEEQGLGIDSEFDRLLEAKKVRLDPF